MAHLSIFMLICPEQINDNNNNNNNINNNNNMICHTGNISI